MSEQGNGASGGPTLTHTPRPKDTERTTRRPMVFWDRIRVLLFLLGAFLILVWSQMSLNTGESFREALRVQAKARWWILVLAALEIIRQFHYFVEENSPAYYRFWMNAFKSWESVTGKINPWTRYRMARLLKFLFLFWLVGAILAIFFNISDQPASDATGHVNAFQAWFLLPQKLVQSFGALAYFAFIIAIGVLQFAAIFWFMSKGGVDTYMPDEIDTRFSDVKGQDSVLKQVRENMIFLEDPEAIEQRGGFVPAGILLWGPPGTGKTLMAQAVAGETAKPYVFVDPGAFTQMFMGVGILKVKGLYRKLRKYAVRYGGVIVFFDEADSLGNRGQLAGGPPGGWGAGTALGTGASCNGVGYLSDAARRTVFLDAVGGHAADPAPPTKDGIFVGGMGMGGGGMGTLQALLSEMSGLKKPRGFFNRYVRKLLGMKPKPPPKYRILHIFATNMPESLDEAMLRPGRIDRIYKVGYPQKEGRVATFRYYLAKVRHELTDLEVEQLATITPYATGASIQDMVNESLVIAIRDGRDTITWKDIIKAKQLKEHGLPDDHEYIERERHAVAVHEACHAVVTLRLRDHVNVDIATIERRGDVGGFVSWVRQEDRFTLWKSEHEVDIMAALASLAGERMFFDGDHSDGVGGDMRSATAIAMEMMAYRAMGDTIAARSVNLASVRGAQPAETGEDRALFDSEFGRTVEKKLQELYEDTWALLEENRHEVLAVAHALETHKTITGDDVEAVIAGRVGTLVDGRPYRDPRFAEELEAYHAAVVQAHKEHAGVEGQIPIPVPPAPEGALSPVGNGHPAIQTVRMTPGSPPRPDGT